MSLCDCIVCMCESLCVWMRVCVEALITETQIPKIMLKWHPSIISLCWEKIKTMIIYWPSGCCLLHSVNNMVKLKKMNERHFLHFRFWFEAFKLHTTLIYAFLALRDYALLYDSISFWLTLLLSHYFLCC